MSLADFQQMAGSEHKMPNYLFHLRFCRFMYLSVHWSIWMRSIQEGIALCFIFSPCLPRAGPPSIAKCPLSSSGNVHAIDISFIIPSKLSLFPSLSFIISTVSSESDCRSCQLAFVCQRQPQPCGARCAGEAGRPYFVCSAVSPHGDMPLLTTEP